MFQKAHAKKIYKYTGGNFRTVKKFVFTLLRLLEYAKVNGLNKYQDVNNTLLCMAALDIGVLHDK
jgi:hypothetical protein